MEEFRRASLSDQIFDYIKRQIDNGVWKPGENRWNTPCSVMTKGRLHLIEADMNGITAGIAECMKTASGFVSFIIYWQKPVLRLYLSSVLRSCRVFFGERKAYFTAFAISFIRMCEAISLAFLSISV